MVGNASWFPPGTAIVKRLEAALPGILSPLDSPTAEADGARDGGAILLLLNGGGARTAAITGVSHSRSFSLSAPPTHLNIDPCAMMDGPGTFGFSYISSESTHKATLSLLRSSS